MFKFVIEKEDTDLNLKTANGIPYVSVLIDRLSYNIKDGNNNFPTINISTTDANELIDIILAKTRNINEVDEEGNTALFYARHPLVIKKLIEAGSDVNHKNAEGRTPLMNIACENYPGSENNSHAYLTYDTPLVLARTLVNFGAKNDVIDMQGITIKNCASEIPRQRGGTSDQRDNVKLLKSVLRCGSLYCH